MPIRHLRKTYFEAFLSQSTKTNKQKITPKPWTNQKVVKKANQNTAYHTKLKEWSNQSIPQLVLVLEKSSTL